MYALERVTVTTLIVVRNLTTLTTAFFDFSVLGTKFSGAQQVFLILIFLGACLYGIHDASYDAIGYVFLLLNCCANTAYQIKVKILVRDLDLSALSMAYYNNTLCLPVVFLISMISGEMNFSYLQRLKCGWECSLMVFISAVLGFILSTSAFRLNQLVSATSLMLINNANKFLIIFYSELFMKNQSIDILSGLGCGIVLMCTFLYSYNPDVNFIALKYNGNSGFYMVFIASSAIFLFTSLSKSTPYHHNTLRYSWNNVRNRHCTRRENNIISIPLNFSDFRWKGRSSTVNGINPSMYWR